MQAARLKADGARKEEYLAHRSGGLGAALREPKGKETTHDG